MTLPHKIVLDDDLFIIYQKLLAGEQTDSRIAKALLGALQPDIAIDKSQVMRCKERLPETFKNSSLVVTLLQCDCKEKTLEELAQESVHKLILTYDQAKENTPYYYCIKTQKPFTTTYTLTCKANNCRDSLLEHLRYLCSDATEILLRDQYLENFPEVYQFLPDKELKIYCTEPHSGDTIRKAIKDHPKSSSRWDIRLDKGNFTNIHDRYLRITYPTHKYEVILSSGFEYLFSTKKEITCIFHETQ